MLWLFVLVASQAADPLPVVSGELDRAMALWSRTDDVPHYAAVVVEDIEVVRIVAREGGVDVDDAERGRFLDVDLRLGTPELDSTHPLRGFSSYDDDTRSRRRVVFDGPNEQAALRHAVWRELDARHRDARERIVLLEADQRVRVAEEDPAPDFEPRQGLVDTVATPPLVLDRAAWSEVLREVSALLDDSDVVVASNVRLDVRRQQWSFVDTEGARLVHGRTSARVSLSASVVAEDGDQVDVFEAIDVHDPADLPDATALQDRARDVVAQAEALRAAPRVGPYTGPVLLSGKAAAVFFHEVLGHRVEGHRNKSDEEGKTFLEYVGREVLPSFVDVVDDPTLARLAGVDLNGFYRYDDEGVAALPAVLVDDGVFRGFLMGRSPLAEFPTSNGHGRRSAGNAPVSRMGNTIVSVTGAVSEATLRKRLRSLLVSQGLEYGYVVEEIDGGFTLTGRVTPNAFNVRASRTLRVWADGRPDELVRGIDLVGTPLVAFRSIVAAGDTPAVFNGVCGAESGWVPVSAVAPAMLFERLEFQLKEKGSERPPLLTKPGRDALGEAP